MKEFTFGFKVMQKQAVMTPGILVVSSSSPELATVRGEIRLNEDVKIEKIRKSVSIEYPVKGASVEISGEDKANIFTYTVSGIEKGTDARTLTVSFDGKSNGIDTRTETKVEIPAKDAFKVFDSQYHQEAEKCIEVTFTNPLPSDADLEGLIGVTDAGRQYYQIEDNVARVYFEQFGNETPELVISSYLKDIDGTELGEEYRKTFENEDIKPQVKIPLKGNILPDSDNLTLTFSAVSLRAVDLSVIKILGGNDDLVPRPEGIQLRLLLRHAVPHGGGVRRHKVIVFPLVEHGHRFEPGFYADAAVNPHQGLCGLRAVLIFHFLGSCVYV